MLSRCCSRCQGWGHSLSDRAIAPHRLTNAETPTYHYRLRPSIVHQCVDVMTVTDPHLLAQAKRGDPDAIAALINQSLRPQGIWARATLQQKHLHLVLESTEAPDSVAMETWVRRGLTKLSPQGVNTVCLQGQALGDLTPHWERQWVLPGAAQAAPTPLDIAIARKEAKRAKRAPGASLGASLPIAELAQTRSTPIAQSFRPGVTPSSRSPRSPRKPLVLRWSDFDPMMLTIVGLVAVYGFLGSLNPSYNGPFMWLHFPNLAIHETGHLLFMPFGSFLMILGGSLTQILFPAAFMVYFFVSRQFFASALTLFWTGQNFMDVAVYIRDAPVRQLPLTVDNIDAHDWWQLLTRLDCLSQAGAIANVTHGIGVVLYLLSIGAGVYCAYHTQQMNLEAYRNALNNRNDVP